MKYLGTMFGVHLYETRALPEGTVLLVENRALQSLWSRPLIEPNPMPHAELVKLVLGPKPSWVKEEA